MTSERPISGKISQIETKALFDQLPQGLAATLINAAALAFVQSAVIPARTAALWFAAITLVSVARFGLFMAFRRYGQDAEDTDKWSRAFLAGVISSAALWGSATLFLFPIGNFSHQAFIGFVLAGMTAGAVASFITSHKVFLAFIIPATAPYAIRLLEQGEPMQIAMGLMCIAFMLAMYVTSSRTSAATRRALLLQFSNDDLVQRLEEANHSLRGEVAERQQKEARLEALMIQVKDAAEAKSQFLANMSHEIRTPLNGVIGMSDVLSRSQLTMRQRHQLTLIQKSARTLLGLLNDILDFSRIEAGRVELETAAFDVRELIGDAVDLLADQAQSKSIELHYVIANDVPTIVAGDQMRLRQVLVNLVSNAVKFTDSGSVILRVGSVTADGRPLVRFSVTDTGIGIKPEFQKNLFDPFKQADPSVTRRYGGTGLGLSISHHLVTLMGGMLECTSEPGRGSDFHFELPLGRAGAQPSRYEQLKVPGSFRVLAADENEVTREILGNYLKSWNIDAAICASGDAVIAKLLEAAKAENPFNVVILSTSLADVSGLELAARISAIPLIKSIKIILATPLNWSDDARVSQLSNRVCTITKPIRQSQLFERLVALTLSSEEERKAAAAGAEDNAAAAFSAHVLLVEDNPINREVAIEYLRAFDCTFDVACNGQEALKAIDCRDYDLILMDCQMPVMDGFAATRTIRLRQSERNATRTPIVALTAGAFSGDRDQCLRAGMDGYLSKPFSQPALERELTKWLKPSASGAAGRTDLETVAESRASIAAHDALDRQHLAMMRERKPDLLQKLIDIYLGHAPLLIEKLQAAGVAIDLVSLKETAHNLKSSSGNMAATGLTELCQLLEVQAMQGNVDGARATVEEIVREFGAVSAALSEECASLKLRTGT